MLSSFIIMVASAGCYSILLMLPLLLQSPFTTALTAPPATHDEHIECGVLPPPSSTTTQSPSVAAAPSLRIVNGTEVDSIAHWPWVALIEGATTHKICGGAVIAARWVLTA